MKILKKVLLWTGVSVLVLVIGAGVAIRIFVTKEFVVQQIEENINGRVHIGDISVPIWAAFSGITIDDFKIGYKDSEMKKPVNERAPMKSEAIGFKQFVFKVAIGKLITSMGKDFELNSLLLVEPKARVVMYKEGGNNLSALLVKKPKSSEEKPAEETRESGKEAPADEPAASEPFSIKSVPTVIKMGKIGMENGQFTIVNQSSGNTIVLSDVTFLLKDIYIDPANLSDPGKNKVGLATGLSAKMEANNNAKGKAVQSFDFHVSINGNITPFDPKTGRVTQTAALDLTLHKGSKASGIEVIERFKSQTEQLKKIGVDLGFIGKTQELAEDSTFSILYSSGKVTFTSPFTLITSDLSMGINKDSWMHTSALTHDMEGSFALAQKHTATVESQIDNAMKPVSSALVNNLPSSIRSAVKSKLDEKSMRNSLLDPARNDKGGLEFGFRSKGVMNSPSLSITKPKFPALKDVVQKEINKQKADLGGAINQQVNTATKQAQDAAKKEADKQTTEVKKQATDKLKKNLPKF